MAINRWVKANWSSMSAEDEEEEKVKFLMSSPDLLKRRGSNEDVRKAMSRNKLIDLLGAEYLLLLNDMNDTNLKNISSRKTRVSPKPNKSNSKHLIREEPEDDVFDAAEDSYNYKKYHHIGTDNWGEDTWNDRDKYQQNKHKRRVSAPILTIPSR